MDRLIYEGKAKLVYEINEGLLRIRFKDDVTALDGLRRELAPGKGRLTASQSAFFFRILEDMGVKTHFLGWDGDRDIIVRRLRIIPIEVIVRNYAYGSLLRRMPLFKPLTPLPEAMVEFHYKSDELHDPLVLPEDIVMSGLVSKEDLATIVNTSLRVNDILRDVLERSGLRLIDFKLEYGYWGDEIVVADEISGDTMRIMRGDRHLDKEVFRRGGSVEELIRAYRELNEVLGIR